MNQEPDQSLYQASTSSRISGSTDFFQDETTASNLQSSQVLMGSTPSLYRSESHLEGVTTEQTQNQRDPRQCWVCFGTDSDDDEQHMLTTVTIQQTQNNQVQSSGSSRNRWVCPCQCRGTMKWVHEECLQRWVDEKQRRTSSSSSTSRVHCSQCKTQYLLAFPPNNKVVKLLERYEVILYSLSPFVAVSGVIGSIYWCCASYGTLCIFQMMGEEEGRRVLENSEPFILLIGLPSIPIMLVLAKLIKWEDLILKCWRTRSPKVPPILSYILGEPPSNPRANCDELLIERSYSEPVGCARMICGALLLPTMASIVGGCLFHRVASSTFQRSLLGGLTFLLIKGAVKIYLRKSQYIRYSQRIIKDYPKAGPSSQQGQTQQGQSSSSQSQSDQGEVGGDGNNDGHQGFINQSAFETMSLSSDSSMIIDDGNDSDAGGNGGGQSPTPQSGGRTLFSLYFQVRSISLG